MNKLHFSFNLYKQKSNPKMSHPFPQTKEKQDPREKNVQKKKKKNVTKEKSWEDVLRPELIQPHPRRACRLS